MLILIVLGSVMLAFGLVVVAACVVAGRRATPVALTLEERATLARAAQVRANRTRMGLYLVLSRVGDSAVACGMTTYRDRFGDLHVTPLGPCPNATDRAIEQVAGYL